MQTIRDGGLRGFAAFLLVVVPPVVFEKYTYYLYTISSPTFFTFSGDRLWFDIGWFIGSGAFSALILGRKNALAILPPLAGAWSFIVAVYDVPFCQAAECYINSTDGFAWLRDFLLFASLGILACSAVLSREAPILGRSERQKLLFKVAYSFAVSVFVVYALGFFPVSHIFAGVTVQYPLNYAQWFLAGAPAFVGSFFSSLRILEQAKIARNRAFLIGFISGIAGTFLGVASGSSIPCEACTGYGNSIASIILLASGSSAAGIALSRSIYTQLSPSPETVQRSKIPSLTIAATILVFVILLLGFFFSVNYQMSVVNQLGPGITLTPFSPVEVGHAFVYSGGYLALSRVTTSSVGVSVNFGNSSIASSPSNFLAAGVGDQSPNCCKDGLDLAYRIDAALYSNGTEAALARAWWACDVNIACGGYSWQHLLHYGAALLPAGSLSRGVSLEMSWNASSTPAVDWLFKINGSTEWSEFSTFATPRIQNHYFDAGVFYVGTGNHPSGDAFFFQFGVSSGYEIKNSSWRVLMQCPWLAVNGSVQCVTSTAFIQGRYSYWKVLYTFGESYSGMSFNYLGNYTVAFYYTGISPKDKTPIW